MSGDRQLRVTRPLYGGSFATDDPSVTLAFVAPGELVHISPDNTPLNILEASPDRTAPQCLHFGTCGGCHYQMLTPKTQLTLKRDVLSGLLSEAGVVAPAEIQTHSAGPYGYRNRIRLRVQQTSDGVRLGYNVRGTTDFLPITMCPIAAPALWTVSQALRAASTASQEVTRLFATTAEVELLCDHTTSRVLITLFCTPRTKVIASTLAKLQAAVQSILPTTITLTGIGATAFDLRTGPTGRLLAAVGTEGLAYTVAAPSGPAETYWIARGTFFQVNRFLLPTLLGLVCTPPASDSSGALAFDLFAGVGLFSRVLARSFTRVVAVESNPAAASELRSSLGRIPGDHVAVTATTLDFLRTALTQRERPSLVILDPPRAGAGTDVCEQLLKLAPQQITYISCDPTTLARDLAALAPLYTITALHLIDLFPQTFHIETVVMLARNI